MARAESLCGRRVALIVDHPLRDLTGLILVAQELCQRGAVCHLVPMNLQDSEIWALRPDFVLLNFLRRGANEDFARKLVRAGIPFGLLDTEGGVVPSEECYAEFLWEDRELLRATRSACMWGPRLAEYLVATGLLEARQVHVTGCARFDMYHRRWRGIFGDEGPQDSRPRILINTNYSTANSRFATADQNRSQLEKMGWTASRARQAVETEATALEAMIDLAGRLSRCFQEATVVVRPHPFENSKRYRDGLRPFANVEINDTGPVPPQLYRASVVVQRSCTTAIEAILAFVPAISPRWIPTAIENPMAENVSIPCESFEALASTVRQILEGRYVASPDLAEQRRKVIHDWFFEMDGMAHRRVTAAICESLVEAVDVDTKLCRRFLYGVEKGGPQSGKSIGSRLRYALRLSPHWSFGRMKAVVAFPRSEKAFTAAQVETQLRNIAGLRARAGEQTRPIIVSLARENGEYSHGFRGHAVTLATVEKNVS
jgi:surface carbohydrate biosynthesis protein